MMKPLLCARARANVHLVSWALQSHFANKKREVLGGAERSREQPRAARRNEEEPVAARTSQEHARRSKVKQEGAWRNQQDTGGARRSQEGRGGDDRKHEQMGPSWEHVWASLVVVMTCCGPECMRSPQSCAMRHWLDAIRRYLNAIWTLSDGNYVKICSQDGASNF